MEDLNQIAKRLSKAMGDTATGPLIVAKEIVGLSEIWDIEPGPFAVGSTALDPIASPRSQASGLSCDGWVRQKVAPGGLAFFAARHRAVERLGEASRRNIHHEVAVWVDRNVPDPLLGEAKTALIRGCKGQNGNPLTPSQAMRILRKLVGHQPKTRCVCRRCDQLEKILLENGLQIPE